MVSDDLTTKAKDEILVEDFDTLDLCIRVEAILKSKIDDIQRRSGRVSRQIFIKRCMFRKGQISTEY